MKTLKTLYQKTFMSRQHCSVYPAHKKYTHSRKVIYNSNNNGKYENYFFYEATKTRNQIIRVELYTNLKMLLRTNTILCQVVIYFSPNNNIFTLILRRKIFERYKTKTNTSKCNCLCACLYKLSV